MAGRLTQEQWRRRTDWPITLAALLFLVVYSVTVLADLRGGAAEAAEWTMWGIWIVFVVDYGVMLALAEHRLLWFAQHVPQFLVVVLPMLRPLRLLRLLTLFELLRRATGTWLRGRVTGYVLGTAALLVYIASLAELEAERHAAGSEIRSFGDALWWACETVTTVGYGERVPVTLEGRLIAVGLMIAGLALLGVITATIASWMVERVADADRASEAVTAQHVDALAARVEELTVQIAALQERLPQEPRGGPPPR